MVNYSRLKAPTIGVEDLTPVTPATAAAAFGVSYPVWLDMERSGTAPVKAITLGKRRRYLPAEIEAALRGTAG